MSFCRVEVSIASATIEDQGVNVSPQVARVEETESVGHYCGEGKQGPPPLPAAERPSSTYNRLQHSGDDWI